MKRLLFTLVAVVMVCVLAGCSHSGSEPPDAAPEKAAAPESRVKRGAEGQVVITLDAATQKIMGLETVSLVATQMNAQVKAFGRVLVPAPLAELTIELSKAELEFDNSHADLERMKVLKQQNNTSEKAFQTAENNFQQNQVVVAAVLSRLKNAWSEKLAEMTGPMVVPVGTTRKWDSTFERILDAQSVLVRVELNSSEAAGQPGRARLLRMNEGALPVEAAYFDKVRTVDPLTQAQGWLFLVETNASELVPGSAVTAFLSTSEAPAEGVVVPRAAVVRDSGATWIYRQTGDDSFARVEVMLEIPAADGWFTQSLKPDAKLVVVGAQQLLSEELKGRGSED